MTGNNKINPKFDILIPTYNGAKYIVPTINSILSQSFTDFNIIICDDASTDKTIKTIKKIKDKRIKIFAFKNNIGYSKNLERCRQKSTAEFIYLMGQDDILGNNALLDTINAFVKNPQIGAVTRPYFWFDKDINKPVRAKHQLNCNKDEIIKINDDPNRVIRVFETLDQLSGLAFRKKFMDLPFHEDIFPCHIYPFASIIKNHPIMFLKDYNIAVRIASSQTRSLSSIYDKSPMLSWIEMFNNVFYELEYKKIKDIFIKNFVTKNYVGLVQLKNYAQFKYLLREIFYLIKYHPTNIINPAFWFFSIGTIVIPPSVLIPLVDWYKNTIYSQTIKNIKFEYSY